MASPRSADLSAANTRLDDTAGTVVGVGAVAAVVGLGAAAGLVFMGKVETAQFSRVWIQNLMFILSLCLGGLFFVLIQHLTRAGWSVVVRRIAEAFAANLRWVWLLFVPVVGLALFGKLGELFPWADMTQMAQDHPAEARLVAQKSAFLNVPFFFIRAATYFVIWAALGAYFWRTSLRQDEAAGRDAEIAITRRMQTLAAPGIILFGLTTTFAAFDWLMSLNPAWYSTIFGVYYFAASCTSAFSAMIVVLVVLHRRGKLEGLVTAEHFQDLGKMLFAFGMVFWAYIAFSQYMLIWYSNQPETTGWFIARQMGGWKWLTIGLLFGHFIIPFLLFISKHPKRIEGSLLFMACWMLVFSWLDIYWLAMPQIPHDLSSFHTYNELAAKYADQSTGLGNLVNYAVLLGMMGLFVAFTVQSLRSRSLIPAHDPRLAESLAFENM